MVNYNVWILGVKYVRGGIDIIFNRKIIEVVG